MFARPRFFKKNRGRFGDFEKRTWKSQTDTDVVLYGHMVAILLLAIIGLALSWHIYRKKAKNEKLVCLVGADCDAVVRSSYGNIFFGIPNEALGIIYYLFIVLGSLLFLGGIEAVGGVSLLFVLFLAALGAASFSLFLVFLQAFVLRRWCDYCLIEVGINLVIFAVLAALYGIF